MSLKAKIEAVIYAAEEPVTLAQLATLFREEALEAKFACETKEASIAADPVAGVPDLPSQEISEDDAQEAVEPVFQEPEAPIREDGATQVPEDEKRLERQRDREAREELRRIVNELIVEYSSSVRGMEIREIAGGYRVGTKPEYHDAVRNFIKSLKPPMKLSLQALETLAVVAYKQPVTAPEVGEIRGVDSAGVLGSLMGRKLVTTAGRKQVIGRPILYKTTKEFLLRFGLKDLNELPSVEEFEKMAGELAEQPGELTFVSENVPPEDQPHPISVSLELTAEETADVPGVAIHSEESTETHS